MFLTMRDTQPIKTVLIDASDERRAMFADMLRDRDFAVEGSFCSVDGALGGGCDTDLVIFHAGDEDCGAVERLCTLGAAIMVLTERSDRAAIARMISAGADQVVPLGVQSDRIAVGAALAVAMHDRRAEDLAARTRAETALAELRLVQRAKGILMSRHGLDEAAAHRRVQKMSMERNLALPDMARAIIDAEDLLC